MHFSEAEKQYRLLEERLVAGELTEDDFGAQVADLRVVDDQGHRWMLSGRTGRWLVHDGQQWVFAEPPEEAPHPTEEPTVVAAFEPPPEDVPVVAAAPAVVAQPVEPAPPPTTAPVAQTRGPSRGFAMLTTGTFAAIVLILCLVGASVGAWVLFLRDMGDSSAQPTQDTQVGLVVTYTPRPATATYTPTPSPTPSRTPQATYTPLPTDTSVPTATSSPLPPTATGTPSPLPSRTPTATDAASPTSTVAAAALTYTVKAGETLSEIAARYGVSVDDLAEANGISNAALVRAGQVLVIPGPEPAASSTVIAANPTAQTYVVKQGETLYEIALRFGVTVKALADANGISDSQLIRTGQVLVIPAPGPTPTWTPIALATPTWTPIALQTPTWTPIALESGTPPATARASGTPTRTPSPTPTTGGATSTPKPTEAPKPTKTPKPPDLSGKIAWTEWNPYNNNYELNVSQINGTGRNQLGAGFRQPQFSPDGNTLVVNGEGAPNLEHILTMDASGGNKTEISNYAEDSFPTWRGDGSVLVYSSSSWGDGKTRLGMVYDIYGKGQSWIPFGGSEVLGEFPYYMADGKLIYNGCDFWATSSECGLYWVWDNGGTPHRLTDNGSDTAPSGSQGRVAFMSSRAGNWEVYTIDLSDGAVKRLTNNGANDGLPTWSPDGKSIAFVSNRDGGWAIWVMNAGGSNQRKLFDIGGYGSGPNDWTKERISWAP